MPHGIIAYEDVYSSLMHSRDQTFSVCETTDTGEVISGSADVAYAYGHTPASITTKPWSYPPPDFMRAWIEPTPWHRWFARTEVPLLTVFYTRSYQGHCGIPPIPTTNTWAFKRTSGWNGSYIYGPDFSFDMEVSDGATARALEDVADGESANLALAFLERKETESLITNSFRDIAAQIGRFRRNLRGGSPFEAAKLAARTDKSLLKARRKAIRRYRRRGESLSDRERFLIQAPQKWIELQYGLKPVLQDIYDSCETIEAHQKYEMYRFSKTGTKKNVKRVGLGFQLHGGNAGATSNAVLEVESSCKVRLDYSINTASLRKLADSGFANPAYLLWNRLPASFLVDWAFNVSGYLNQFSAALGKDFLGGTKTTVFRAKTLSATAGPGPLPVEPGVQWTMSYDPEGSKPKYTEFSMNRVVLTEFPSPVPPALKDPRSLGHLANALSLLALAFGRRLDVSLLR